MRPTKKNLQLSLKGIQLRFRKIRLSKYQLKSNKICYLRLRLYSGDTLPLEIKYTKKPDFNAIHGFLDIVTILTHVCSGKCFL